MSGPGLAARAKRGLLTQAIIAERSGLSVPTVRRVLHDTGNPTKASIERVEKVIVEAEAALVAQMARAQ